MSVPANSPVLAALAGGSLPAPTATAAATPAAPFAAVLDQALAAPKAPVLPASLAPPLAATAIVLPTTAPLLPTESELVDLEPLEVAVDDSEEGDEGDDAIATLLADPGQPGLTPVATSCAPPVRGEALAAALQAAKDKLGAASGRSEGHAHHPALPAHATAGKPSGAEPPVLGDPATTLPDPTLPTSHRDAALAAALQAASQTARDAAGKPLGPNPRALQVPRHLQLPGPALPETALLPAEPDAVDTLQSMLQIAGRLGDGGRPAASSATAAAPAQPLAAHAAIGGELNALPEAISDPLPPGPTPDLHSAEFADDMANQLSWLAERRIGNAQLRIHPDDLGPVDIQLQLDGDRISVEFGARHAETRQALEAGLPRLRELFEQQGLSLVQADVGQQAGKRDTAQTATTTNPTLAAVDDDPANADGGGDASASTVALGLLDTYA